MNDFFDEFFDLQNKQAASTQGEHVTEKEVVAGVTGPIVVDESEPGDVESSVNTTPDGVKGSEGQDEMTQAIDNERNENQPMLASEDDSLDEENLEATGDEQSQLSEKGDFEQFSLFGDEERAKTEERKKVMIQKSAQMKSTNTPTKPPAKATQDWGKMIPAGTTIAYSGFHEQLQEDQPLENIRLRLSREYPEFQAISEVFFTHHEELQLLNARIGGGKAGAIPGEIINAERHYGTPVLVYDKEFPYHLLEMDPMLNAEKEQICFNLDELGKSPSRLRYIYASDGFIYVVGVTEVGIFSARYARHSLATERILPPFRQMYVLKLKRKIPYQLLLKIQGLFRHFANERVECMVHIYWDRVAEDYFVDVPAQQVTSVSTESENNEATLYERAIKVMELHSHHDLPGGAYFSQQDNLNDWRGIQFYSVMGHVSRIFPQMIVSYVINARRISVKVEDIFEFPVVAVPDYWMNFVTVKKRG